MIYSSSDSRLQHLLRRSFAPIITRFVIILSAISFFFITGCANTPKTMGELYSGYTYIPVDPLSIEIKPLCGISKLSDLVKTPDKSKILRTLPDNTVRLSMEVFDSEGNISYGVSKIETKGSHYKLTADYINSDTVNIPIYIKKAITVYKGSGSLKSLSDHNLGAEEVVVRPDEIIRDKIYKYTNGTLTISSPAPNSEKYTVTTVEPILGAEDYTKYNLPVYVGIGLRVIADGTTIQANASISGIGIVANEAGNSLNGYLTVQTLGVSAKAASLPIQHELTRATAENAFVALGAIKAILYDRETTLTPRVVGFYLPLSGGKKLVNAIISALSTTSVAWCPIILPSE